ncbi:MAG TPA: hypothetical protein VFR85_05945 [Anaeromyxobacteraceae bacterium]|nr:hypothetical protein [Anaeromyxobacteraceae bacterium]
MFPTIRRIALAIAGAAALVAAGRARADHDGSAGFPPAVHQPAYRTQPSPALVYREPAPRFAVALPAPPAWLDISQPPAPTHGSWTRAELLREYRWLDRARVRFYRYGPSSPRRVRQFEAWFLARRAELDRRWEALAWAPGHRHGWRGEGWDDRGGFERGRSGERWGRDG